MKGKYSFGLILFLVFSIILSACTKPHEGSGGTNSPGSGSAEQDIYAQAQTVTELDAVNFASTPAISAIGNGKFVTAYMQSRSTDTEESSESDPPYSSYSYTTYLDVFDSVTHEVTAHRELEGEYRLIERTFSNGNIVAADDSSSTLCIFDSSLNKIREINAKGIYNATFSYDCDKLYYTDNGNLLCMDLSTGESVVLISADTLFVNSVESAHPKKPWLNMYAYTDPCASAPNYITIDIESGELIAMQDGVSSRTYNGDSEYAQYFDSEKLQSYIVYKTQGQDSYYTFSSTFDGDNYELRMLTGSPYMLRTALSAELETADESILYRLDSDISKANLTSAGVAGEVNTAMYMPEADLTVCYSYDSEAKHGRLYIVDMRTLSFESVLTPEIMEFPSMITDDLRERYKELIEPAPLPKSLDELRAYADGLEEKYAVHIFISGECAKELETTSIKTNTTDKEDLNNELLVIKNGLGTLDQVFSLYPDGFFRQFRTQNGEGGIYVYLAGNMSADYPVEAYASFDGTDRYRLVMNICQASNLKKNFYHELWHTTESKILTVNFDAFDYDKWNKLNPTGFGYTQSYTEAVDDVTKWIYKSDDNVYFIDDYAKRYPHEDRARLMEHIMANNADTEELLKSDAIRAKLKFMCDAIRQAFDTALWENVPWEKAD